MPRMSSTCPECHRYPVHSDTCPRKPGSAARAVSATRPARRSDVLDDGVGRIRFWIFRDGHKPIQVDGKRSDRKCGARCQNSLGPSCSCECGGHNHGKALWGNSADE